jgi:hypothetical protein
MYRRNEYIFWTTSILRCEMQPQCKGNIIWDVLFCHQTTVHIFWEVFSGGKKKCTDNKEKMVINFNNIHGSQSSTVASEEQPEWYQVSN